MWFVFFVNQKAAYEMRISDWSSDLCSSDLRRATRQGRRHGAQPARAPRRDDHPGAPGEGLARPRLPEGRAPLSLQSLGVLVRWEGWRLPRVKLRSTFS